MDSVDSTKVIQLSALNQSELENLYSLAILTIGLSRVCWKLDITMAYAKMQRLISVAGVRVYSQQYKVAALGNYYTSTVARARVGKSRRRETMSSIVAEAGAYWIESDSG